MRHTPASLQLCMCNFSGQPLYQNLFSQDFATLQKQLVYIIRWYPTCMVMNNKPRGTRGAIGETLQMSSLLSITPVITPSSLWTTPHPTKYKAGFTFPGCSTDLHCVFCTLPRASPSIHITVREPHMQRVHVMQCRPDLEGHGRSTQAVRQARKEAAHWNMCIVPYLNRK